MQKLSVVIICKNSAGVIEKTLQSFAGLTDDIVVYDNGSTDGTTEIVKKVGANLFSGSWEGFGKTKNKANSLAKYNWILSLDADEAIDDELKHSLQQLPCDNERTVYDLLFRNFVGHRFLKYGEWGRDHHIRLFNRKDVRWNDDAVHEQLIIPDGMEEKRLKGFVLHRTANNFEEFEEKMNGYAVLNAQKYFNQGKKTGWGKQWLSPVFSFMQNYIFRLGFLDGKAGFDCARITARYTFLKYAKLKALNRQLTTGSKHETP
jgi:glycosyltransferase involved in cell wall biosynthesis